MGTYLFLYCSDWQRPSWLGIEGGVFCYGFYGMSFLSFWIVVLFFLRRQAISFLYEQNPQRCNYLP
jgi:hypothetical protein